MKKKTGLKKMAGLLLAAVMLCMALAGTAWAEDGDEGIFSYGTGVWYGESAHSVLTVTPGRFEMVWTDTVWTGTLSAEWEEDEDGEEIVVYTMTPDGEAGAELESAILLPDLYHPGKMTYIENGTAAEVFHDSPVFVEDVSGQNLSAYEPYGMLDAANGKEPAITMMFMFLAPVTDFEVMGLSNVEVSEEGELIYDGQILEIVDACAPGDRFAVTRVFEGDLPNLAISFVDEEGKGRTYTVQISGADGELILWEEDSAGG